MYINSPKQLYVWEILMIYRPLLPQMKNTFQLVLISDGKLAFALFLYDPLGWEVHSLGAGQTLSQMGLFAYHNYTSYVYNSPYPGSVNIFNLHNIEGNIQGVYIHYTKK